MLELNPISILVLRGKIPLELLKRSGIYGWRGLDPWELMCLVHLHLPPPQPAASQPLLKSPELG